MALKKEIISELRKYAIKNAMDYGKARVENVLAKVARSVPKESVNELKLEAKRVVDEINSLSKEELGREYSAYEAEFERQYEMKVEATSKPRMELDGAARGSFSTRFAPEPSGYLHIGHASAAFLAKEFARIYDGKAFLYFDDTNPEKEKQEFVDAAKSDLEWLGIKFDKEYYASDNMEAIYECARKLIKLGKAYACECAGETIKSDRFEGKECAHRNAGPEENSEKFESMLQNRYDEERIVLRIKGDMKSQNTALRDPTIMRVKKHAHYRQGTKYVVWPTYDFNTPINDSMFGVTDAIRTKEYELRGALYDMVLDYLQMRRPSMHLHGRISIKGQPRQKREIRALVSDGLLSGFDDPRLVTIAALRRRGVRPSAIKEFVLGFGMSITDSVVDIGSLMSCNKRIIDGEARRLYYVPAPVDLEVKGLMQRDVEIRLHPSIDMGARKYTVRNSLYISGDDASSVKDGDILRLKELFSVSVSREDDSLKGEITDREPERRVQWVCDGNYLKCRILVPDAPLDDEGRFRKDSLRVNEGYIESYASSLREREIVQLERFGFCILDDKERMQFIFISK
ncbi:MAG: glutamate--tRNA ligase [Candidatus Micrarchaeota archaeon]|nr:glutamate--tRNA ligase [Candidatus Micrarchaeota archaeon]